jgi:hypothetical protein
VNVPVYIRILKSTHPSHTSGASSTSPAKLVSGTAVPALAPEVNTAATMAGNTISLGQIFDPGRRTWSGRLYAPVAKKKHAKKKHSGRRQQAARLAFDMMPAYSEQSPAPTVAYAVPASVNTPLSLKAEEELSEFEREYPW